MCRSKAVLCTVAAGCLLAAMAQATTVPSINAAKAIDTAELIFTGHVVAMETATSRDGLYPFTFVTFEITETLKGSAEDSDLTLRFEGGDLEELEETLEVVGMPRFELGDEVLLFVRNNGRAPCPLVGWWQGRLDFQPHPETRERLLVDHRGRVLEGVGIDGWRSGEVRYDKTEKRLVDTTPKAQLLWQDGVVIEDELETGVDEEAIELGASTVLDDLRQLIQARQTHKSFIHPRTVRSASPLDVPDSMAVTAVAPIR